MNIPSYDIARLQDHFLPFHNQTNPAGERPIHRLLPTFEFHNPHSFKTQEKLLGVRHEY
jgi:hypothetical protein